MARKNKINTRLEIIEVATAQFLANGYTETYLPKIAKELGISLGNLTFYFPTKEHLLAEFVKELCDYQWNFMSKATEEGNSSLMAYCLEFATIVAICEDDRILKDIYVSVYTHPMALKIIRERDAARLPEIYGEYCKDWTDRDYRKAEAIASGIEYGTIVKECIEDVDCGERIAYALDSIMKIYNIPEDVRKDKVAKVMAVDYKNMGANIVKDFYNYVSEFNAKALAEAAEAKKRK